MGRLKNGMSLDADEDLGIVIFYDPPPVDLTRGTGCKDALLRREVSGCHDSKPPPRLR